MPSRYFGNLLSCWQTRPFRLRPLLQICRPLVAHRQHLSLHLHSLRPCRYLNLHTNGMRHSLASPLTAVAPAVHHLFILQRLGQGTLSQAVVVGMATR